MHVLAIDPFHGGSHRQFLVEVRSRSRHRWEIVPGKPVHWKWRMRSAPLELAAATRSILDSDGYPDLLFCTDMLDLPSFRGLVRDPVITELPTVIYFHENQWSYPIGPNARPDNHFGYTNLLSALAADACWFNSQYHFDDFHTASEKFVCGMPDAQSAHDFSNLREKSRVIPPGFAPRELSKSSLAGGPLRIGWVSRWEYDKRPDVFLELLELLEHQGTDFQLILLGARPTSKPKDLSRIEQRFAPRILHNDYAATAEQYWNQLAEIDVVVSTADHEFFGIAVCEAIWAGAVPMLPNRLSYPELAIKPCLFDSLEDAAEKIKALTDKELRSNQSKVSREKIEPLSLDRQITQIDDEIDAFAGSV